MKRKYLFLAIAALLVAGGLWFARGTWRAQMFQNAEAGGPETGENSNGDVRNNTPDVGPTPGQMLRPPDPNRKYRDLTPEQRVKRSRQPQGG